MIVRLPAVQRGVLGELRFERVPVLDELRSRVGELEGQRVSEGLAWGRRLRRGVVLRRPRGGNRAHDELVGVAVGVVLEEG